MIFRQGAEDALDYDIIGFQPLETAGNRESSALHPLKAENFVVGAAFDPQAEKKREKKRRDDMMIIIIIIIIIIIRIARAAPARARRRRQEKEIGKKLREKREEGGREGIAWHCTAAAWHCTGPAAARRPEAPSSRGALPPAPRPDCIAIALPLHYHCITIAWHYHCIAWHCTVFLISFLISLGARARVRRARAHELSSSLLGNSWRFVETARNSWKLLESIGNYWRFLEILGNSWKFLEFRSDFGRDFGRFFFGRFFSA